MALLSPQKTNQKTTQDTQFAPQATILLVDDDRTLRMLVSEQLDQLGYRVIEAENGQKALDILHSDAEPIDIIILDREMPVMDGMQMIGQLKQDAALKNKIVIMSTGHGNPEQINQGVAAGVFYYLVKPVNYDVLSTIVSSAVKEAQRQAKLAELAKKQDTSLHLLTEGSFAIQTLEEAHYVTRLLVQCFPDPDRAAPGIEALIVNGIEHGNLGIGYERKKLLLQNGEWEREINHLQNQSQNQQKKVTVQYQKIPGKQILVIKDEGGGFDWQKFMQFDAERVNAANGRGIMQARRFSFNEVTYNTAGNQVIAVVYDKTDATRANN